MAVGQGTGTGQVHPDDWAMFQDAMFLVDHPAWTWQALQDTPEEVVDLIRRYGNVTVKTEKF